MSHLGPQLPSWMVVGILFFILFVVWSPVFGRAIQDSIHLTRDQDTIQQPSVPKKEDLTSTTITKLPTEIKVSQNTIQQLAKSTRPIRRDTLPGLTKRQAHSTKHILGRIHTDSILVREDSSIKYVATGARTIITGKIHEIEEKFAAIFRRPKMQKPDSAGWKNSFDFRGHLISSPIIKFGGGYINYGYNYRSSVDTPFAEQNIGQHNINGSLGLVLANSLPVNVNFFIRRSNSLLFRDITDIQVSFDPAALRNGLVQSLQHRVTAMVPSIGDSLMQVLNVVNAVSLPKMSDWLASSFNSQRVRECREMIQINELHPENMPTDSVARMEKLLQLKQASLFIKLYDSTRVQYDSLLQVSKLLETRLISQRRKLAGYRQTLNGRFNDWSSYGNWRNALNEYDPGGLQVPDKYKWLMGIRSLSVGKTPLNYSELTAKNIGLTGLNFEYNSWYYLALAAGTIDYRFRDFITGPRNLAHQYLVMLRAGLGRLEKNYFIVSFFKGQKQLYNLPGNNNFPNSITITGITAETKWQVNNHTYFIAEGGESIAPDFRSTPVSQTGKFTLNGKLNKALSLKFYTAFPKIGGRLEGLYKYTGANYQSFSSFQNNAAINTWYLKWEQNFFKRQLKITGSLRSNEFSNPYIVQQYKSNTLFKSVAAVLRIRKWPVVSFGYMPMSQFSVVGQQVTENRFQTLTGSLHHFYKIGNRQAFTSFIYNRFYNTAADSGFVYFNATNFYISQNVVFKLFTAGIGVSDSKSTQYHLTSGEITLQVPFLKKAVTGLSVKVNHLNGYGTKAGGKCRFDFSLTNRDRIGVEYEKAWLPGNGSRLVNRDIGNIVYSKSF